MPHDARQGGGVVDGVMRSSRRHAEPVAEVRKARAAIDQRTSQRQRVEEHQLVETRQAVRQPPEHGHVEGVTIVGYEQITAHEVAERRPGLRHGGLVADVGVPVAVDRARLGSNRS
jgi:hypothetical protein